MPTNEVMTAVCTIETVTCCTYYFPGFLMSESETRVVTTRVPDDDYLRAHKNCFAFQFFDKFKYTVGSKELHGENDCSNFSPRYYVNGVVQTHDEIALNFPDHTTLLQNIGPGESGVLCRAGNWQPWNENCQLYELR